MTATSERKKDPHEKTQVFGAILKQETNRSLVSHGESHDLQRQRGRSYVRWLDKQTRRGA